MIFRAELDELAVAHRGRPERDISLSGDGEAIGEADSGNEVDIEVNFQGLVRHVTGSDAEPLLTSLLHAGLDVPNSCQIGDCSTCRCLVEDGEVILRKNNVLADEELAEGWALACQAIPKTPRVKISFEE